MPWWPWWLISAAVLWWGIGTASFIWWWRERFPLTVGDAVLAALYGSMGPIMFVISWVSLYPPAFFTRELLPKRNEPCDRDRRSTTRR